jgi:DNA-binding NtrC family response regulator
MSNSRDSLIALPQQLNNQNRQDSSVEIALEMDVVDSEMVKSILSGPAIFVAVLEDEPIYQKMLVGLLIEELREKVLIDCFSRAEEAKKALSIKSYDLVIIDVDLGHDEVSGFSFLTQLADHKLIKVVHTNRSIMGFSQEAYERGADYFLPKPMTRTHFVKFLHEASSRKNHNNNRSLSKDLLGKVILVDDEPELLKHAKLELQKRYEVLIFSSVDEFLDAKVEPETVSYIFLDRYIGRSDLLSMKLPISLRKLGYHGKIYLYSNSVILGSKLPDGFDGMIPKELVELRSLLL